MANGCGRAAGTVAAPDESVPHAMTAPADVSARPWSGPAAIAAMLVRPPGRVGYCPQATTVLLVRKAMHLRQAKACTFADVFGGEERIEDFSHHVIGDAHAGVGHSDRNRVIIQLF